MSIEGAGDAGTAQRAAIHRALGDVHRLEIVDALRLSDQPPGRLAELTGLGSNLVAFHLGVLESAGVVERGPSQGDARRRYVRLCPGALRLLAPLARLTADDVLFVCTANSARSQLAAALWRRRTGCPARSAGQYPAVEVHPLARATAARHGVELGEVRPQGYDAVTHVPDLVVSVCDRAHEAGPPFAVPMLHWSVPDPVGRGPAAFEAAFEELTDRIEVLAASRRAVA